MDEPNAMSLVLMIVATPKLISFPRYRKQFLAKVVTHQVYILKPEAGMFSHQQLAISNQQLAIDFDFVMVALLIIVKFIYLICSWFLLYHRIKLNIKYKLLKLTKKFSLVILWCFIYQFPKESFYLSQIQNKNKLVRAHFDILMMYMISIYLLLILF